MFKPHRIHQFYSSFEETSSGCWQWKGCMGGKGYGIFYYPGGQRAHRASWVMHYGEIPEGYIICHKCDNPGCVNPKHLFIGTQKDNMQDCSRKGRLGKKKPEGCIRGEDHPKAKLTPEIVKIIRNSSETNVQLGYRYGVSPPSIRAVKLRKSWKHIE